MRTVHLASLAAWLLLGACATADPGPADPVPSTAVDWATTLNVDGAAIAVRARGEDAERPLLLVIHGGPGYAMIDLFHTHLPELEHDFVVVSYDQRGAGLSYAANLDPQTLTLARHVADAHAVRAAVLAQLGRSDARVYVLGHSMGTMIGLELVKRYPASYAAYIGVGQVVAVAENEQGSYDFALAQAHAAGNAEATHALQCVGRPRADFSYPEASGADCDPDADGYDVTSVWVGFFGGDVFGATSSEAVETEILASPAYAGHDADWRAGLALSNHLFGDPAVLAWDARASHRDDPLPLFFFMGRHDYDTPAPLAAAYSAGIRGPHRLVWFEASAHFPFFEEPSLFASRLRAIVAGTLAADE